MANKIKKPKAPKGKELEHLKKNKKPNYLASTQYKRVLLPDQSNKHTHVYHNKDIIHKQKVLSLITKVYLGQPNTYACILEYIKEYNLIGYPFKTIELLLTGVYKHTKDSNLIRIRSEEELLQIQSLLNKSLESIPQNIKLELDNSLKKYKTFNKIPKSTFTKRLKLNDIEFELIRWILDSNYYFLVLTCQDLGMYDSNYYKQAIDYIYIVLLFDKMLQQDANYFLAQTYNLLAESYKKEYFKENNSNQDKDENLVLYIKNHKNAKIHYRKYINEVTVNLKADSKFKENINNTYYKYRAVNIYTLQSLSIPYIYFANPQELNDPMDIIAKSRIFFQDPEFTPRVFSMSINYNNSVMWGHYADGHKGFVIKYCFQEDEKFLKQINDFTQVDYKEKKDYFANNPEDMLRNSTKRKHTHWQYEEEYRFVIFYANGILQHNSNCIKAIYFGLKCSTENKKIIYQILSHHQVKEPIKYYQVFLPNNFSNIYKLESQEVFWNSQDEEFQYKPTLEN